MSVVRPVVQVILKRRDGTLLISMAVNDTVNAVITSSNLTCMLMTLLASLGG